MKKLACSKTNEIIERGQQWKGYLLQIEESRYPTAIINNSSSGKKREREREREIPSRRLDIHMKSERTIISNHGVVMKKKHFTLC